MSSKIETYPEHSSVGQPKQEPLTVRDKIVNLVQDLESSKDEQRRVNNELDQEIQARTDVEAEAAQLRRHVQLVEVNLDNANARVDQITAQLIEMVKVSETARQICNELENKSIVVKDKEIDLENQLRKAKERTADTDKRLQESLSKLDKLQERMELAERRYTVAEQRIHSLEQDIRHAYAEMKTLAQADEKTQLKEEKYRKDIEDLQTRLKSAQQRTDDAEVDVGKLQLKVDKLKEKLVDERKKCHQIEKMIKASSLT